MGSLVLKLLVQYVESHPEQIVSLVSEAAEAGLNALKKHNATQKSA